MKETYMDRLLVLSRELVPMALEAKSQSEVLSTLPAADVIKLVNKESKRLMVIYGEEQTRIAEEKYNKLIEKRDSGSELSLEDLGTEVINYLLYKRGMKEKRIAEEFNTDKKSVSRLKKECAEAANKSALDKHKESFRQACENLKNMTHEQIQQLKKN